MNLTEDQATEIAIRINSAFGPRDFVVMNTASQIGQTNFYGDEIEPQCNRADVMNCIACAIDNWSQPEEKADQEWIEEIATGILNDIL